MVAATIVAVWLTAWNAYAADGDFVWARHLGGDGDDTATGIAVDGVGNVYTVGICPGGDLDPGPGTFELGSSKFLLKLDRNGNFVWAKALAGMHHSIVVDPMGNLIVSGSFTGTEDFDPGPGTLELTSAGMSDMYVCKFDAGGSLIWARQMGGVGNEGDVQPGLATDSAGNVYTTSAFSGPSDFDPGAGTFELTGSGAFVSKLDTNGDFVWAAAFTGWATGHSVAVDGGGNVYCAGNYSDRKSVV